MSEHGMIHRTKETGCGRLVEELYCYATDKQLSDIEHEDIVQWARHFEECSYSEEQLQQMPDDELIQAAYWIMAEYASGQV